jgi:hypothetical protein
MVFILCAFGMGDEIHLTGGKIVTGKITSDTADFVKIKTDQYGELSFPRNIVEKIVTSPAASPTPAISPTTLPKIPRPTAGTEEILSGYDAVLFGVVKDVFIKPEGGDWMPGAENMQLKIKDELRTGQGKMKVKLRGRGEVRLPPNSHMILLSIDPQGDKVTIELKGGRIWNNITPGGGVVNYTIKTPDLVAGVRGTLFKVSLDEGERSRVAVFEGSVYVTDQLGKEITVNPNLAITSDKEGKISQPLSVNPDEIKEWTEWDQWALEVHQQIASRFIVGGQQIDAMAKLAAEDGKKYEKIMNEANAQILYNKEAERVESYKNAFLKCAQDTGIFPPEQLGFAALIENPGVPGWKGPYIKDTTLPILDRWAQPIKYVMKKSETSGNEFGELHSSGPDRLYQEGKPGTDDIRVIIPYYQLNLPR